MGEFVYFTEEQKQRANAVDLEDFLSRQGEKLLRSGREKRLASDHSITVRGNRWYDHATEKGGCAIDFVRMFYNQSFPDAVTMLLGGEQGVAYRESVNQQLEPKKLFVLPEANQTMHRAFAYLIKTRCVDPKVVSVFAGKHMIYEDVKYHNVVFVGFDSDGIPRHAHKRGTCQKGQPFKGNVEGCDPRYSFPIIQSFAQLEKNYGKEGSSIIIDNCQDILFGGFAPNSESAEILSKALGNRTVLSGSISRGKNDPSQSLQMMSRPLMAPEELKTLPKGNFILAKTGVCPMKTRLPLFLKWGIRFEEVYEVPEQAAREVVYADRLELEEEIVRRSDFDEEDLWRGSVESGKLEEASFLGGKAHGETAKEKQHKAATRRLPLRTD